MMGSKRSLKPSKRRSLDSDIVKKEDVDDQKPQQPRMSWKMKYELINSDSFSNGAEDGKNSSEEEEQQVKEVQSPEDKTKEEKKKERKPKTTVLAGLSGYLSSSDSDSDSSEQEPDINSEVQAFLKEIDEIKLDSNGKPIETDEKKEEQKRSSEAAAMDQQQQAMREYYAAHGYSMPTTSWQECYDSSSGYSYYWNVDTNEVRWEIPADYKFYLSTVKKQWEEYNRSLYSAHYGTDSSLGSNPSGLSSNQVKGRGGRGTTLQNETVLSKDSVQSALQRRSLSQTSPKATTPTNAKRKSSRHSDSEEEKIELITSYGPNSDDQSSEDESQGSDTKRIKKTKRLSIDGQKADSDEGLSQAASLERARLAEESERQEELKRRLASRQEDVKKLLAIKKEEAMKNKKRQAGPLTEGPTAKKSAGDNDLELSAIKDMTEEQTEASVSPIPYKPDLPTDGDVPSPGEVELVERLKTQAEVLKKLGGELPEGVSRIISEQSKSAKNEGSLVAGYEEPANSEDEEKELIDEVKEKIEPKCDKTEKEIIEESSSKQLGKDDKLKVDPRLVAAAGERVSKKVLKLSAKAKQLINASETTKRARQTDFINTPLGLRPANSADIEQISASPNQEENDELDSEKITKRSGLGYTSDTSDKPKSSSAVQFVSGGTTKNSGEVDGSSEVNIEDCKELLMAKMKFLSEGKEPPSPVQIWVEQLEILHKAWESKCLKVEFLSRWLQTIGERLTQLESSAAPPGWLCLWSREERRYCYKRLDTGQVVWEFPVSGEEGLAPTMASCSTTTQGSPATPVTEAPEETLDLGEGQGEIEMELCMTPPPPPSPPSPPPPPVISETPSPPPAPLISFSSDGASDSVPPLPEEVPPPLPDEAPPPLPDEAPPLPLDEAPPLPPGEPLPPGLEPPHPELPYTPPLPASPPASVPPAIPPPLRALLPHPSPQDYGHIVMTPASYHHLTYHQMHYGAQSQYSSAFVSAAPIPAPMPPKPVEVETKPNNMSSELDSFYSDLATLEPEESDEQLGSCGAGGSEDANPTTVPVPASTSLDIPDISPPVSSPDPAPLKKRKKPKLAPGLALKKKGVSSLVAKWQKVQQSARRDF